MEHDAPSPRFLWSTQARMTEHGPNGCVTPWRIVDWLQEAAAVHSHQVGWPVDRLRETGALWFVRELTLVIDQPLQFQDAIEIETWVSDLRRFRTHREYRVRTNTSLAVRAQADWLFLSRNANGQVRPQRPPEAMKAAFPFAEESALGDGVALPPITQESLSGVPPAHTRTVMPAEIDENGHVNHTHYVRWIEDLVAVAQLGPIHVLRAEFLKDADVGDELQVYFQQREEGPIDITIQRSEDLLLRAVVLCNVRLSFGRTSEHSNERHLDPTGIL